MQPRCTPAARAAGHANPPRVARPAWRGRRGEAGTRLAGAFFMIDVRPESIFTPNSGPDVPRLLQRFAVKAGPDRLHPCTLALHPSTPTLGPAP